ncbi:glycosyltransferase family 2 protein [Zobellella denitrificans]
MHNLLVSIIIPVFNKELYVSKSISSVLMQTYKNIELIVIDDGSLDNSKDEIFKAINGDDRCSYFYQPNQGVSAARNKGIELAKGDYISFLDADDEYMPEFVEEMMRVKGDADFIYCAHYLKRKNRLDKASVPYCKDSLLFMYLLNKCNPHTNSWMIKRALLNKSNIRFDERVNWGEDMLFLVGVIIKSRCIDYLPRHLTIHSVDVEGSLTSQDKVKEKINKDIVWMKSAKLEILDSALSTIVKRKLISAIDEYRLPAAIVYRLASSKFQGGRNERIDTFKSYASFIRKMKLINGLRSVKLFLMCIKVRFL